MGETLEVSIEDTLVDTIGKAIGETLGQTIRAAIWEASPFIAIGKTLADAKEETLKVIVSHYYHREDPR